MDKTQRFSTSRLGRLAKLGQLAGGIAVGLVSEGTKQLATGKPVNLNQLILSPQNIKRLSQRLSEMRGAAMKIGQLLSMDTGTILPPELADILAHLRENAHAMPLGQVAEQLEKNWGNHWDRDFKKFNFTPFAAASIGQVHEAELLDGTHLAIKIQYPGVQNSINHDIDNLATLLRVFRVLPEHLDISNLLEEAKHQLHDETNYLLELQHLQNFQQLLSDHVEFELPQADLTRCTSTVLTMSYLDGVPIETLVDMPEIERTRIGTALVRLVLKEILCWGQVQSDPNFGNYRYHYQKKRIQLLDFGATRRYSSEQQKNFSDLLLALLDGDNQDLSNIASQLGYFREEDPSPFKREMLSLFHYAAQPLKTDALFDFNQPDFLSTIKKKLIALRLNQKYGHLPPADILFLHRKIGGLYLLLARLQVKLPLNKLLRETLAIQ